MKKSLIFKIVIPVIVAVVAVAVFLGVKSNASSKRSFDGSEKLYVNLGNCSDSWWNNAGCFHRAYLFGDNTQVWADLSETKDKGIYEIVVPKGTYTHIILTRCETKTSTWSEGTVYNQTGDIKLSLNSNYMKSFKGEKSADATWSSYGVEPTTRPTHDPDDEYGLVDNVQDGVILHAFDWSYNTIKENLEAIAEAGYSTVQTSPVQQPKDYNPAYKGAGEWWKLYQPVSFSIAEESWLGTKDDLISLCEEADKYGIKIICDIVSNHLASKSANNCQTVLNEQVQKYEPTLYNDYNQYFHQFRGCNDSNVENVVWGNIGMPDLNTANTYVQERVISLLKECIDCGVDGFRFDAAKHIETSQDGYFASNYWSNVLGTARSYAQEKGVDLYVYGEILNTVGGGRSVSAYTDLMSITDNKTGNEVLANIKKRNAQAASSSYFYTEQSANKLVIWGESHDTYSNKDDIAYSANVNQYEINKAYAIVASRADAASLYFARPADTMGVVGSTSWKNAEIEAVNDFHNMFVGASEYLGNGNGVVINERYFEAGATNGGAVLVNANGGETSVNNLTVNKLGDGQYTDTITGNTFTVSGGMISGNIGNSGIAVVCPQ